MLASKFSKTLLATSALLCVAISSAPALADPRDDKIAAMEAQMQIMMQEIQTMKAERATEKAQAKAQQTALSEKLEAIQTKTDNAVANIAPAAGAGTGNGNDDVKITLKSGTPKIEKGNFSWQPTGRIHLDAGHIDDDKVDNPNSTEFRRARIGMKGSVAKDFDYKLEADLAGNDVSLNDAYINYSGIGQNTDITIGHFKPGYSLEETMSSNDLTFIERAAAVDSFTSARKIGAGFTTHDKNWSAAAGIFGAGAGTQSNDDEEWSVAGRATAAPLLEGNKVIHLGASAAYREPDQANDRFDFDARAENRLQTSDSVSLVLNDAEDAQIYGLEAAAALGPLSLQGEYILADVNNRGGQDPRFDGYYAQLAYTLTGESRPYKSSNGAFGGIKPNTVFDPANGGWGAVELAARYSTLDLNDSGLNGGELDTITLGANWYLNNHIRFMGNVIFVDTDENAVIANDDPTIFITRSQVKF